jgi:uncharacterized protein YqjF (DUF2071 family)
MKLPFVGAHPFAVDARFDYSCTLTFAVPKEEIQARLPACLEPDVFEDRWGFIAVAVVRTCGLRPAGFPSWLGRDFVLVGYRLFVRYRGAGGRSLRGLYILRSETDKRAMTWLGNVFTGYRYATIDVRVGTEGDRLHVESRDTGLTIDADLGEGAGLPEGSPFNLWTEARRFSGPMPFTFSADSAARRVLIVEGVRSEWVPRPIRVLGYKIPYLDEIGLGGCRLANAFVVKNVPYHWKKGVSEPWPDR